MYVKNMGGSLCMRGNGRTEKKMIIKSGFVRSIDLEQFSHV